MQFRCYAKVSLRNSLRSASTHACQLSAGSVKLSKIALFCCKCEIYCEMSSPINKQPIKVLEIPLNKFQEVIPHHQKVFEQHKIIILKLISQKNVQRAQQECKNKKRSVKQLKDLMYELDSLRAQVEDSDLDKFDIKTLSLRKIILNLVTGYGELEKKSNSLIENVEQDESCEHPFKGVSQLQIHENLDEIKLKQRQDVLNEVESINQETEDLQEIFLQLNDMVEDQRENVEHVEESIESTHTNVRSGLQQLVKAHKIKSAAYPITGAFLGGIIGGPIGLVAGLKVGGITALGCAVAGYTGGKFFKKAHENETASAEFSNHVHGNLNDEQEKKHI